MNRAGKTAAGCAAVLVLLAVAGYLIVHHPGNDPMKTQESAVPPGRLVGLVYSDSSSMLARSDFFISLSPQAILKTSYYPALDPETAQEEDGYHLSVKENVPITAEQWADVEQIVLELYPRMESIPERLHEVKLPPWLEVRDGVDTTSLTLTWNTENGTQSICYYSPNDRRIHTLIALLKELADPIGREIPRYDPPELIGIYIYQCGALFSPDYSFQFTQEPSVVYGEDAPYVLYTRFTPPGQNKVIWRDWIVPGGMWDDFAAFAREIHLEEQPDGRSKTLDCALYYSDGRQTRKKLDTATAKQIREYFTKLALQLLDAQP